MLPTHLIMGIYGYSTHHPKTTTGRKKALLQQGIMNQHDPVIRPYSLGYGGVPLACRRIIYHLTSQVPWLVNPLFQKEPVGFIRMKS